ncbi:nucleopolyhedrovirus P10 family protein [Streptomyces sp. 4N509B]|uniref:nucleopolyhedrovirus P10 family protein n=1 Tax=Streptomyces sp. 4N509B TaxID=3457413 RepID=UPI003FD3A3D3
MASASASDRLLHAVRRQLGLGRLLPLGDPADGAWVAERAAGRVLRRAVAGGAVPGVRLEELRIALADGVARAHGTPGEPAAVGGRVGVPPPPSALPPGPLRIEATCAVDLGSPLPTRVAALRDALAASAGERLGLVLAAVDVHVARLWDTAEDDGGAEEDRSTEGHHDDAEREDAVAEDGVAEDADGAGDPAGARGGAPAVERAVAEAVRAVPGVRGLTGLPGGPGDALRILDPPEGPLPGRLVRLQIAVTGHRRTVTVAREVRAAAAAAAADAPGPVTVSVLVTDVA